MQIELSNLFRETYFILYFKKENRMPYISMSQQASTWTLQKQKMALFLNPNNYLNLYFENIIDDCKYM